MKKKIFSIIPVLLIIITIYVLYLIKSTTNVIQISINNKTSQNISNLYVTYTNCSSDISIPIIKSNQTKNISIHLPDSFTEGNITLYYYDYNNIKQEQIIIGYVEKNSSCNTKLVVKSISLDGILNIIQ